MSNSIHQTVKKVFAHKSKSAINSMCDLQNPDFDVIELRKKRQIKHAVKNARAEKTFLKTVIDGDKK